MTISENLAYFDQQKPSMRMRRSLLWLALVVTLLLPAAGIAQRPASPLPTFPTQQQAEQHCPADTVVWLNLPTGIYHFQGQRWYGNTNSGAYVCQREALR
jgi:hypothetical protein